MASHYTTTCFDVKFSLINMEQMFVSDYKFFKEWKQEIMILQKLKSCLSVVNKGWKYIANQHSFKYSIHWQIGHSFKCFSESFFKERIICVTSCHILKCQLKYCASVEITRLDCPFWFVVPHWCYSHVMHYFHSVFTFFYPIISKL